MADNALPIPFFSHSRTNLLFPFQTLSIFFRFFVVVIVPQLLSRCAPSRCVDLLRHLQFLFCASSLSIFSLHFPSKYCKKARSRHRIKYSLPCYHVQPPTRSILYHPPTLSPPLLRKGVSHLSHNFIPALYCIIPSGSIHHPCVFPLWSVLFFLSALTHTTRTVWTYVI